MRQRQFNQGVWVLGVVIRLLRCLFFCSSFLVSSLLLLSSPSFNSSPLLSSPLLSSPTLSSFHRPFIPLLSSPLLPFAIHFYQTFSAIAPLLSSSPSSPLHSSPLVQHYHMTSHQVIQNPIHQSQSSSPSSSTLNTQNPST